MQTPLCDNCLMSKKLCDDCQEKLNNNEINRMEISVLRFIYNLSNKTQSLKDIKVVKVLDRNVLLIITGRGDAARLVGKGGAIVKLIAKKFKKSIRILEEASNLKEFIEELLTPANINGINTLYRDNEEIFRVRIPEIQKNHLMLSQEDFSNIVSSFYDRKAEFVFEV
jgi:transcription antitermination factor NusA-like protein